MVKVNYKAELWSELSVKWAEYKKGELELKTRVELTPLEIQIEQLQKDLGVFDKPEQFNVRWANRITKTTFSNDELRETLTKERTKLLQRISLKKYKEAKVIRDYITSIDPEFGKNAAGVGQIVNLTLDDKEVKNGS